MKKMGITDTRFAMYDIGGGGYQNWLINWNISFANSNRVYTIIKK
jgi:hypothetical protein